MQPPGGYWATSLRNDGAFGCWTLSICAFAQSPPSWVNIVVKMKPEHWITLGNLLLTAIGLYFGPKFAVTRSLEQFRTQKLWERKDQAYTQILSALTRMKQSLDEINKEIQGKPFMDVSEAVQRQKCDDARWLAQEMQHQYIVSAKTQSSLCAALETYELPLAQIDTSVATLATCISIVMQEARGELALNAKAAKVFSADANPSARRLKD